jgi:prophage antirepressor-like protein
LRKYVDVEDKLTRQIGGTGQRRNMTLINESGLYSLILSSKLDSAKKFKRWVTSEVLPAIRKTGSYSVVHDKRWEETRLGTKISHKPFTRAIQLLISHLRNHGEERPDGYIYGHLTNIVQTACDIRRGERDLAPVANLNKLDQVQSMIANLVLQLLASRPDIQSLEQFEATIILQLDQLNRLLGGHCPLLAS